jgi:ABC-2 type transport system ATP-binding protein
MRKLYKKEGVSGMYPAVRSFNLAVAKNETFGLLGPNGAGKTTLISMITGMF